MKIFAWILSCFIFTTPSFSQYSFDSGLRPDVTFGDHNDRFDVSPFIDQQNRYFRADGSMDYRRRHNPDKALAKKIKTLRTTIDTDNKPWKYNMMSSKRRKKLAKRIKKETDKQINNLANQILLRMTSSRRIGGDEVQSSDEDIQVFNNNLGKFRIGSRRSLAPDDQKNIELRRIGDETNLFNYAFPIDMNVEGYLVAPVDK